MAARGHRKRLGDDELVAAFLAATADRSVHEVEQETENAGTGRVSHGTVSRLRRGAWSGLTAETRRSLEQYLAWVPPAADGRGAELRLVAGYLERLARALRQEANAHDARREGSTPVRLLEFVAREAALSGERTWAGNGEHRSSPLGRE